MEDKITEIVLKVFVSIIQCLGDIMTAIGCLALIIGMLGTMCGIPKGKKVSLGGFIIAILGKVIMGVSF